MYWCGWVSFEVLQHCLANFSKNELNKTGDARHGSTTGGLLGTVPDRPNAQPWGRADMRLNDGQRGMRQY